MKVSFNQEQIEYLRTHLSKEAPRLFIKWKKSQIGEGLYNVNVATACLISDWAGERMQRVGFEGNDAIIIERDMLYSIIDLLYS